MELFQHAHEFTELNKPTYRIWFKDGTCKDTQEFPSASNDILLMCAHRPCEEDEEEDDEFHTPIPLDGIEGYCWCGVHYLGAMDILWSRSNQPILDRRS
jgi:hypothetical protein